MDQEVTDLLADLVRLKSVNPLGGDASVEGFNEAGMARYVERYLREMGLEPEVQQVAPHRPNVYAVTRGGVSDPPILFEAHMDTVPAETWAGDAWDPIVRDGCMHGRGTCDTKGSLAAMLEALRRFLRLGRSRQRILFLATCSEECGLHGARAWAGLGLRVRFGVVGEPTGLEIVRAHKGAGRWRLTVRGQSVHSAHRDQGVSAITRMARVVLCLERLHEQVLRRRYHDLLGSATLSVGRITGGQSANTVPDLCCVEMDRRLLPGETADQAREEMLEAFGQDPDIDFDVEFDLMSPPIDGLDTPEDAPVVQRAARACRRVLGRHTVTGASYGTDASAYAQVGIPCVVLGPGDIRVAHSDHECIDLDELEKAVGVYLSMMRGE